MRIWLSVNGGVKQNQSTGLMLFRIPRQLSDISKVMTLEKGDLVLTGTPKGVGEVIPGDRIKAGIAIEGWGPERDIDIMVEDRGGSYEFQGI